MSSKPTARPARVRCYSCGKPHDAHAESCLHCHAALRAMCACGASYGVYEEGPCASCGAVWTPRTPRRLSRTTTRFVKLAILALPVAFIAYVVLAPRPKPAWKLKAEARDLLQRERFDEAMAVSRDATVQNPGDKEGWYLLAYCSMKAG